LTVTAAFPGKERGCPAGLRAAAQDGPSACVFERCVV
jgi:hypothetical protein